MRHGRLVLRSRPPLVPLPLVGPQTLVGSRSQLLIGEADRRHFDRGGRSEHGGQFVTTLLARIGCPRGEEGVQVEREAQSSGEELSEEGTLVGVDSLPVEPSSVVCGPSEDPADRVVGRLAYSVVKSLKTSTN